LEIFLEIIEHNESGKILERNNPAELAEVILKSCTTDDLNKMGENAKCLSESKYSWKNIAMLTKNVYEILFK
jgi:glycosyltransferase involved in cell wall biosynthesis